jgi:hypothetical protein
MLKHLDGSAYFDGMEWWNRNREALVFKDEGLLRSHQEKALRYLRTHFGHPPEPLISQIPALKSSHGSLTLKTSGTMSAVRREYHYPWPQYEAIENHHWWRIENAWGLTAPGVIVEFFYNPRYLIEQDGYREWNPITEETKPLLDDGPEDKLYGPRQILSLGSHNSVYHISYNRITSRQTWAYNLERAAAMKPKLVVMSPSQFQAAWFHTGGFRFGCPVVMTREVLTKETRRQASEAFTTVIDKMRCWDGGLGFYECPFGRRHVYDELSIVREEDSRLISTDLFNYCHPFINYWNGDTGRLGRGKCGCGVYGSYLEEMNGRVNDAIMIGGVIFPGSILVEDITGFFRFGNTPSGTFNRAFHERYSQDLLKGLDILWRIKQRADETIEFRYFIDGNLTGQQQEALGVALRFLVGRDGGDLATSELDKIAGLARVELVFDPAVYDKADNRSKTLTVSSDAIRNACN